MYGPSLGVVGDHRFPWLVGCVLDASFHARLQSLVDPFQNTLPRRPQGGSDLAHRLASMIAPEDL